MKQTKTSSKIYSGIKSALATAALPVIIIYILIAKPDYKLMNGMAHIVLPVANWAGDVITWPIRAVGNMFENLHTLSTLRTENEELRVRLDAALADKNTCDTVMLENQKLNQELDIITHQPRGAILANIIHNNDGFNHHNFFIDRGVSDGMMNGMVVVSFTGNLVGIISDVAPGFSRVRTLTDSDTNIAVRIAGTEVYGFLQGNGSQHPTIGFFSDPQFQATPGIKLITSNISGVLPTGINVGTMKNESAVNITNPKTLSSVMVLQFDKRDEYK